MKRNKNLLFTAAAVICTIIIGYLGSSFAVEKTYEINTEYSLSDYRTDTARAIDAYQQMINRLLDSNEKNNVLMISKLDALHKDIQVLSGKIERLEKAVKSCHKTCSKKCADACMKKCGTADLNEAVQEQPKKEQKP